SRPLVAALAVAIGLEFLAGLGATTYLALIERSPQQPSSRTAGRPAPDVGDLPLLSQRERTARTTAIRSLLAKRSAALIKRDRAAFLAGIDPGSPGFRVRQGQLFDNLREVPLGEWSYTVDPAGELVQSPRRLTRFRAPLWVPRVHVSYRIAGFDARPTVQRQVFTFVQRSGRWYIGADDDFEEAGAQTARGLWDFGPVVVTRTSTTIVLGHPRSMARLRSLARACDQAIPRVSRLWGSDWAGKVVVLVPDTQAELSRIIQEGNDLSQIAAVATAELAGSGGSPAGERIIVNPPNFDKLGALGRRVVLQHEIAHLATRSATTASTPTWLACRLIAVKLGQRGLVRFYRSVGAHDGTAAEALDAALRSQLKLSTAQFTQRWRNYLAEELT
ncbi:MAG: hypothetical protein LC799_15465, partial [Actinobacteria bacterium]|nr:hypothetical protein [Actinomycetota bacterium]